MTLFRTNLGLLALIVSVLVARADVAVLSDLDAAKALAAKEGRQIVVEFSGRTWCGPCQALVREVLSTPEFEQFAANRVVVHLDYPRKSERTPEKVAANPELAKLLALRDAYQLEGFPTVVLLDASGREVNRMVGYEPGMGPAAYLKQLTAAD